MTLILSGTDGLSDVDGSAATPAIRGTDANTGIFFPAADTIAFSEGGVEAMRINSSGNLLMATTGEVQFFTSSYGIRASTGLEIKTGDFTRFLQGTTEYARIDSSGNVGIGTSSPDAKLDVTSAGTASTYTVSAVIQDGTYPASGNPTLEFNGFIGGNGYRSGVGSIGGQSLAFYTPSTYGVAPTERARIDSSGNLLVGTTNNSDSSGVGAKIIYDSANTRFVATSSRSDSSYSNLNMYSTTAGAYRFYVNWAGTINATSTTITSLSDVRHKENIRDLDDGLEKVMALQPRKFDWKENKGQNIKNARGFIAQEFETVFPDMIEKWLDPAPEGEEPYKAINANLIPTLVKAIQEQQALITQLTNRITALEGSTPA